MVLGSKNTLTRGGDDQSLWWLAAAASVTVVSSVCVWRRQRQRHNNSPLSKHHHDSKYVIPIDLRHHPTLAKELQVAVQLARQAGDNMVAYCNAKGTVHEDCLGALTTKGSAENFCTQVDVDNERLIMDGLQRHFPHHSIIGEESTGTGSIPPLSSSSNTWIIDPIDGTTNFAAGLPLTCVSIGLCDVKGQPVLGVVYAPMTQELYMAIKNAGAYRNGVRLAPAAANNNNNNNRALLLRDSVICFELGYAREQHAIDTMLTAVSRIMEHGCRATRSLGTGVLDICYVATGRLDVVYAGVANEGWKPWDYCAGVVIAQEAGCVVEAIDQKENEPDFDLYSDSIICATSKSLVNETRQCITRSS